MSELCERLERHARQRPDAILLSGEWGRLDARALKAALGRAMSWLDAQGLQPGQLLALCLSKGPAFVTLHLAALRRGVVLLPLNPRAPSSERDELLALAQPQLLVLEVDSELGVFQGAVRRLDPLEDFRTQPESARDERPPPPSSAEPAVRLATSGTTGRPKLAQLSHGALAANQRALQTAWGWRDDDVLLHLLPTHHVHGLMVALHGALWAGAECRFVERFEPAATWAALRDDISVLMCVPTLVHRLVQSAPDDAQAARLRLATCGSAPLAPTDRAVFAALTGVQLVERYGMTETGILTSQALDAPREHGGVGRPLAGVELRLAHARGEPAAAGEEAEVQVRGSSLFDGYWQRPDATAESFTPDGWLRTGDVGRLDERGELHIAGRIKELIISGGFNIHPREVELALERHPAVSEAAVVGLEDPDLGERVVAAIVPREDVPLDAAALIDFAHSQLSAYKCPREITTLSELPRNAMGKLQRARVAAQLR